MFRIDGLAQAFEIADGEEAGHAMLVGVVGVGQDITELKRLVAMSNKLYEDKKQELVEMQVTLKKL